MITCFNFVDFLLEANYDTLYVMFMIALMFERTIWQVHEMNQETNQRGRKKMKKNSKLRKNMKYILVMLILILSMTGCGRKKDIVILYTNDVHCGVTDNLGYVKLAAYKSEKQAEDKEVLLVDAGDMVQGAPIGALSEGEYIIDIMNQVPYDIATVGNHEFDYGMEQFMKLKDQTEFSLVCCNFIDETTGKTVLEPYEIRKMDGDKVAFVGIATPKTLSSSSPTSFQDEEGNYIYGFCQDETGETFYQTIQDTVDAARKDGADYVIALGHLGIDESTSPYMSTEVIENTTGIDAFIDGHSHSVEPELWVNNSEGKKVLLTQTGTKLAAIGELTISTEGAITSKLIEEYDKVDTKTEEYIASIEASFAEMLQQKFGENQVDLLTNDPVQTDVRLIRNAETNMGDFCADAYRIIGGSDIAMVNGGGIRCGIEKGEVLYEDLLNVHPFGNMLSVIEVTGQQILDALEMGVMATPAESGGFQQVSGMTYEIDVETPSSVKTDENGMFVSVDGDYRVKNVQIGGAPLDLQKTYTLTINDYTYESCGDGFTMFKDCTAVKKSFSLDCQVLVDYLVDELGGVIGEEYAEPYGDERITAYSGKTGQ